MNATDLATLSMIQLKALCSSHAIDVTEDRRFKASWISAIERNQRSVPTDEESTYTIGLPTSAIGESIDLPLPEVAAVMAECHSTPLDLYIDSAVTASTSPIVQSPTPQPTPQQTKPKPQYRGASIVMIIPLILLTVAVILIKIGISTIIPLISSLMRFTGSIWQSSITGNAIGTESIPIDSLSPHETLFPRNKWALLD